MRSMLLLLALSFVGAAFVTPAFAASGTIKGTYFGCLTDDLLDEFTGAANKKDYRQLRALLGSGCYVIEGLRFSTVDVGFLTSQIRVYAGDSSMILHVPTEAVRDGRD